MKLKNIILITLIIILEIALIIMTKLYFNMRASAQDSLTSTLELAEEMFDANVKIEKLEEDIENLKNGKEIQTHNFLAEIKEIKEEKGKTFFVVDGLDSNSENDYKGELTITIDEETKFLYQDKDIDISEIKVGQNISIIHSGKTVTKHDVIVAPFIYEIEILDNTK